MYKYKDLIGKSVLITGASGDLGMAICESYLAQQCIIYALYKSNQAELHQLKESHPFGQNLHIVQCDLIEPTMISALGNYLAKVAGKIDVLINNAGVVKDNLFSSMSVDDFSEVMNTNMVTIFRLTKEMLLLLNAAENPTVINVASVAALIPSVGQCNYSASKGAILAFTRTLAAEMAPRGIRVNAVAPGMIASKMVKKVSRTVVREVTKNISLKRMGTCEEVANTIVFLSSTASSYIVGQTIVIDGGLVMR